MTLVDPLTDILRDVCREAARDGARDALAQRTERRAVPLAEAARLLSVSEPTVKTLIATGELTALRVGKQYRIGVRQIDELLERGATIESVRGAS